MSAEIIPVILCGGSGTRLWPLSRRTRPKQFLKLMGERSLLQDTVLRARGIAHAGPLLVVTDEEHRFLVLRQLQEVGVAGTEQVEVLLEPAGRNTAPAVAAAAMHIVRNRPDALMVVLPSDHHVEDPAVFAAAIDRGAAAASDGMIVLVGVRPTGPNTGYGYIRRGPPFDSGELYRVAAFKEKPDLETARKYLAAGNYFWNAGMHLMRPDVYLRLLEQYAPEIVEAVSAAAGRLRTDDVFLRFEREDAFRACRDESIEHAVLERLAEGTVMTELDTGWSDLGSWPSLREANHRGAAGNATQGNVILADVSGSYVHSSGRLVAAVGLRDQVVVETPDAVLVAPLDRAQDVKRLVGELRDGGWKEADDHLRVYRPWGWYEVLERSENVQLKRIQVLPGASLSLQLHHHRSEHWLVLQGEAEVTLEDEVYTLREDETIHVPVGAKHRLANHADVPLKIIEIQRGSYVEEDDIVRFEDQYGRTVS